MSKKQSIRGNSLVVRGVKPVSKLLAHNTSQCVLVDTLDRAYSVLNSQLLELKMLGMEVYAVARLQVIHGVRISEVLSIIGTDIDRTGGIIIRSKKGSSMRKIIDTELITFWLSRRLLGSSEVFEFDRFYIYRLYKSVGISHEMEGKSKKTVTHYARHLYIKQVQEGTNNIEETALIAGHKSSSSTKGYLKSKPK